MAEFKNGKYYSSSPYGMVGDIGSWISGQYRGSTNPANRSGHMNSMVTGNRNVTGVLDREGTLMNRANAMPKDVLPVPRQKPVTSLPSLDTVPVTKINAPSVKVQKPKVLTRAVASAVADKYNASTLPPLVAPATVATQPQVVPTDVPEAAQPVSPMEVAMYNARANGEIADKNNQTLRDVAQMGAKSDWEKYGSLASGVGSMAGGLAGIYGAYANAKYQKDQTKMQKSMIRSDEANKSAFAKAAGGTYQSSGV